MNTEFIMFHVISRISQNKKVRKAYFLKAFWHIRNKKIPCGIYVISGDSLGIRTLDPLIKSQMLYQLS